MSRFGIRNLVVLTVISIAFSATSIAQSILTADGQTAAYTRIKSVLASSPETPDCSHPAFGPHITQLVDDDPNFQKYVFDFNIHVTPDNDRCSAFDRQRLEIKTEGNKSTPDYLKGFLGDSVTFRWDFKLADGFQPSTAFTHIHQIKAYDGDDASPLITLTPRKATPNRLELIHIDSHGVTTKLATTPLDPFIGHWVEGYEKITYSHDGQYSIVLTDVDSGVVLFTYSNNDLDLWRTGTTVIRPKWGIYRSLNDSVDLRDEQVHFDRFCLAKGTDDCVSDKDTPEFSLASVPTSGSRVAGGSTTFQINANALRGFAGDLALSVPAGLPPGATVQFTPSTISGGAGSAVLTVTMTTDTDAGEYPLVIEGISGVLSHVTTVPLEVSNFALNAPAAAQSVSFANEAEYGISVTPLNGFNEPVYLTLGDLPAGVTGNFSPGKLEQGAGNSILHLRADKSTPVGTYQIQVLGSAGSLVHSQTVTLVVTEK